MSVVWAGERMQLSLEPNERRRDCFVSGRMKRLKYMYSVVFDGEAPTTAFS